ncbi:LacI family DNA-binding transcriptional regulator [Myceligenerans indicum]|uniref:Substrate-binding domain-containing protein n=1 Tax=Myceligenerans indicum TaxID=2593663 RepID=A0ABS1LER0_9MICO|nr:substrate-binding domain-containing protein [Myceligenerans indicum]MBL0884757.1 substrate-binding domain-containing protein [Myceligenerans indicum]
MTESRGSSEARRRRPTPPGPSMTDVAALAGVSAQTVSRVAREEPTVREATAVRVRAAMEELGYTPNRAARALRYGHYGTVGMIAHRLARTGESRTVEAVVEAAQAEGYTVTLVDIASPAPHDVSAAVARLSHQDIDGLIIIRAESATPDTLALPSHLPVVVSDSRFVGHHPAVGADQAGGARAAVEHLLGLGHRTVHHLAGPADSTPARQREESWRSALTAAGATVPAVVRGDWTAASGHDAGAALAADPEATAVFAANDEMAAGLVRALHEAGRSVPADVSVVGFDGIELSAQLWPPLTTVEQDFGEIGRQLVDLLLRQVRDDEDLQDTHTVVPVRLVERQSTAPPRP